MEKKGCLSCLGCLGIIVLLSVVIVSFSMCGNSKNDDAKKENANTTQTKAITTKEDYLSSELFQNYSKLNINTVELNGIFKKDDGLYVFTEDGSFKAEALAREIKWTCSEIKNLNVPSSSSVYPIHEKVLNSANAYYEFSDTLIKSIESKDATSLNLALEKMNEGTKYFEEANVFISQENTSSSGEQKSTNETSDESVYTVAQDAPEPNTTDMTEYIIKTARSNAESATDASIDYALNWIKENKTDFFKDNATMEAAIYYGSLLGYVYKDDDLKKITDQEDRKTLLDNLGQDTQQAVKGVYRNVETVDSIPVQENLRQIEKSLVKIK